METTLHLPEGLAHRLERIAEEEGTSVDGLIRRLISEHGERRRVAGQRAGRGKTELPLIPMQKTGVIRPVSGADLDEMFAFDTLPSRR